MMGAIAASKRKKSQKRAAIAIGDPIWAAIVFAEWIARILKPAMEGMPINETILPDALIWANMIELFTLPEPVAVPATQRRLGSMQLVIFL